MTNLTVDEFFKKVHSKFNKEIKTVWNNTSDPESDSWTSTECETGHVVNTYNGKKWYISGWSTNMKRLESRPVKAYKIGTFGTAVFIVDGKIKNFGFVLQNKKNFNTYIQRISVEDAIELIEDTENILKEGNLDELKAEVSVKKL